ncbi:quinone oxidoreductase family protein [Aerococcus vaginalis]
MKAIRIHAFGDDAEYALENVTLPDLEPYEVRVELQTAGVNPNETYVQTGNYAQFQPELPYTPGFDGCGKVIAVGHDVERVAVGDRVHVMSFNHVDTQTGTYAEMVQCHEESVWRIPDTISDMEAAVLGIPSGIACRALERAQVTADDTVLVHGASGAVGTFLVQIAKALGARVIGTSSQESSREQLLEIGADRAIPHLTADNAESLLDGEEPSVIIEMASEHNLQTDISVIQQRGRIVCVGARGDVSVSPRDIFSKECIVTGAAITNATQDDLDHYENYLYQLLSEDKLHPVVSQTLSLKEAKAAQEAVKQTKAPGKIILTIK